jgi:hypothetical protein
MVTAAESTVLAPAGATKEPTINPMIASTARTRVTANHLDMPHNLQKSAEMTRRRATQSALMACEAKRQIRPARPDTARPLTMGCACLRLAIRAAHWPRAITCGPRKRKNLTAVRASGRCCGCIKKSVDDSALGRSSSAALRRHFLHHPFESLQIRDLMANFRDMVQRQLANLRAGVGVSIDEAKKAADFVEAKIKFAERLRCLTISSAAF